MGRTGMCEELRRDKRTGNAIGIAGVHSVVEQGQEFIRSGLPRTPVFLGEDLEEAQAFISDKLAGGGVDGVSVEIIGSSVYLVRKGGNHWHDTPERMSNCICPSEMSDPCCPVHGNHVPRPERMNEDDAFEKALSLLGQFAAAYLNTRLTKESTEEGME